MADVDRWRHYLRAAQEIAAEAASTVRARAASGFQHRHKADGSFVTEIDLEVEDLVRRRLAERFPEHGVVGEERGADGSGDDYRWIVDPVDGTHSLRHRVPLYGTLLALRYRGETRVGVLALPELSRIYSAARGAGCFRDGRRIRLEDVAGEEALADEIVAIGDRRQFTDCGREEVFDALMAAHPAVRTYTDCFGHALALDGSVGAMVDFHLRPWDVAATEVLIREAGGAYLRVGGEKDAGGERYDVIFGKPSMVRWIVQRLRADGVALDPVETGE